MRPTRRIFAALKRLTPAGRTPLTFGDTAGGRGSRLKAQAGRHRRWLPTARETCGGSPCDVSKQLHASAEQLTVHTIGYRPEGFYWIGEDSILGVKRLADANRGLYIAAPRPRTIRRGAGQDLWLLDHHAAAFTAGERTLRRLLIGICFVLVWTESRGSYRCDVHPDQPPRTAIPYSRFARRPPASVQAHSARNRRRYGSRLLPAACAGQGN